MVTTGATTTPLSDSFVRKVADHHYEAHSRQRLPRRQGLARAPKLTEYGVRKVNLANIQRGGNMRQNLSLNYRAPCSADSVSPFLP